jgi:hypothetical protein
VCNAERAQEVREIARLAGERKDSK